MMATRAPSIHNTQPWLLRVTDDGVEVRADRSRQLAVLDPQGRQLLMSCGGLLHHLSVVAGAMGLGGRVELQPEPGEPELVGRLLLTRGRPPGVDDVRLAEAILHRSTRRTHFSPGQLSPERAEELRRAAEEQGAMLKLVSDEVDRIVLTVLTEHAEQELLDDPRYEPELAAWVWEESQEDERADGIPAAAVDPGPERAEEVPGRQFRPGTSSPDGSGTAEHPDYVVVTTTGDAESDWVRAGMALSALLLVATRDGLAAQPIGQVTDVPAERARLRHHLGLVGVPQLVLRMGVAAPAHGLVSPRRPLEDVLQWSDALASS
jgi:nitroreductase